MLSPPIFRATAALDAVRSGRWLSRERLRVYPALIGCALLCSSLLFVATGHGGKDWLDRPFGTDFVGVWVAGREVLSGHAALPYDNFAHAAAQALAFGDADSFLPWGYPPLYLGLAALLAAMPYLVALAVFQGSTVLLYLAVVSRAARGIDWRRIVLPALAFPAVTINVLHGHNGFLSTALLAGGALAVSRKPLLAGLLFGLLAYKPQFGLAIPVALMAGRHWQALAATCATVALTVTGTILAFGLDPWWGFATSLRFTRHVILESGGIESYKLQSAFAATRLLGGSVAVSYVLQACVSALVLAGLAWLWRSDADGRLKLAGLVLAALLATPYAVDYDMTMLGPALAALVSLGRERGFPPYARSLLAFAWLMPLLARSVAAALAFPLGVVVMLALYALVLASVRLDRAQRSNDDDRHEAGGGDRPWPAKPEFDLASIVSLKS